MFNNSDLFFKALDNFQNKRRSATEAYRARLAQLEPTKGSKFYTEQVKKAADEYQQTTEQLRGEVAKSLTICLETMRHTNGRRPMTPPTEEEVRLLTVLKMRDNLSQSDIERAARSCTTPAAADVVMEIATKHGAILPGSDFDGTTDLSLSAVQSVLDSLKIEAEEFISSDISRPQRLYLEHYANNYGPVDWDTAPLRPLLESKDEAFAKLGGINGRNLAFFYKAVDGED